ncbi:ABC transporter substrate-binding protein [Siccirubricoccus phaeus]|uniref:ABC transporter substrate-binding protein n=1 Tax=Siccirubricoccus phaeus TaxID=2595053 RepID=UPI00165B8F91|nr:ABC transporter substrate-binding protein [Siccirubricoccus phaeus]
MNFETTRRGGFALAAALLAAGRATAQQARGELRIGMTAADIPTTRGAPDQGAEGIRWMGFTLYDSLVYWNLNQESEIPHIVPGLAERWYQNPENQAEWIFELRRGVKFHDGAEFDADAVIWNFEKLLDRNAPHYDPQQRLTLAFRIPSVKSWRKIESHKLAIGTGTPDAYLLDQIVFLHISSPAQWKKLGGWDAFSRSPSGTGPFRAQEITPRQRAVLVPNAEYWDVPRRPKVERLLLLPIPDPNTRVAALLSGQVNFIEAPPPDAVPALRAQGMVIKTNPYPHIWPYILRIAGENTPLADVRVRRALNLAVNRDEIVALLGGMAVPATGMVLPDSPWFGKPGFRIRYDPAEAKRLLAEAGYGPRKPLSITFMISPSGSGQMQPLPMNEVVQQQLRNVDVDLKFEVVEWNALRGQRVKGPLDASARGLHALNNSMGISTPFDAFQRFFSCDAAPPEGLNWSGICEPPLQALLDQATRTFDEAERDKLLARVHEHVVDNAYWLWVVHDVNPRALRPEVQGFFQAKSWYQDLTQVTIRR